MEILVAMFVLATGLLCLLATGSAVLGQLRDGTAMTIAAGVARSVVDSLRARPCSALVGGSDSTRMTRVTWAVAPTQGSVRVDLDARYPARRAQRTLASSTLIPCATP